LRWENLQICTTFSVTSAHDTAYLQNFKHAQILLVVKVNSGQHGEYHLEFATRNC